MSQEDIRDQIKELQELFKSIANDDSAEPRDIENDLLLLGDLSLDILSSMKDFEDDMIFTQECLDIYINEYLKYISYSYEITQDILISILDLIYPCINALGSNFNIVQADTIILIVINYFQQMLDVNSCGLDVLSCLASCMQYKFSKYLDVIWPYVVRGWNKEETSILRSTLGLIAELAITSGKSFSSKLPILDQLFDSIEKDSFNQEVKPDVYTTIGDIFLSTEELTLPYLDRAVTLYKNGFASVVKLNENPANKLDDEQIEKYQEKIIESYSCVHISFKTNPQFLQVLDSLQLFFQQTCIKQKAPTTYFLQLCLGVISDLLEHFKEKVKQLIEQDFTKFIVNELETANKNCKEMAYYQSVIKKLQ